jgi:glycosyltransferase involved in cell wall biosynthesis
MRLLYFTDNNSDHNRRFLEKLVSSGHEVFYLSLAGPPATTWLPEGVRVVPPAQKLALHTPPAELHAFVPELRSIIADVKPDLVHAGPIQSCGYLAALADAHPLLAMSWGSDILVDATRDPHWKEATLIALNGANGFFCDCDTVRERARQLAPDALKNVVQFPWGLRRGVFGPDGPKVALPWGERDFVLISTRSWEPGYGIEILLQAFERAQAEIPELRLLLIGGGSREQTVRAFIAEHDLTAKLWIPGSISTGEMPKYFRSASAYISCTPSDGTSISLLEAIATGLPAIVADNSSNREWLTESVNGWFGKIENPRSFAEKIVEVAALDSTKRSKAAALSQQTVSERADWDKNFPLLLQAYEDLVNRTDRSSSLVLNGR